MKGLRAFLSAALAPIPLLAPSTPAAVPTPDHVVIVIEENHSAASILGNPDAPYINSLAAGGASFTNFFAISHPSQPNYLQFFSGASQGVTTNNTPLDLPYSTANLGASLINAGHTFAGYSEDLPYAGFVGDAATYYVRRHNPWVNWQADSPPASESSIGSNQLSFSTNQPFSAFPSDYSQLPSVSIVVPSLINDMHDGSIADADTWLVNNIEPYRAWAMSNNSLLILTWDEDEHTQNNQIATIFSGPMVRTDQPAATDENWNLHNLLRTVEDMYSLPHSGSGGRVAPITGVWLGEAPQTQVSKIFRHNSNGYSSVKDTYIESAAPATPHHSATIAVADGSPQSQALIRFDDLIGTADQQIEANSQILRATLTITTGGAPGDGTQSTMSLHRMLAAWAETDTWTTLLDGVSADGVEALAIADNALTPEAVGFSITFDVTATLQAWANGEPNYGWVINPSGTDGWRWNTSEAATAALRPILEVTYVPEPSAVAIALMPLALALRRRR